MERDKRPNSSLFITKLYLIRGIPTNIIMANPNPNTKGLIKIPRVVPEGTSRKPVQVKVPVSQYDAWMAIPAKERNDYLRKAIADKLAEKQKLASA